MGSCFSSCISSKKDKCSPFDFPTYNWRENNVSVLYPPITREEFDFSSDMWKKRKTSNTSNTIGL